MFLLYQLKPIEQGATGEIERRQLPSVSQLGFRSELNLLDYLLLP